MSCEVKLWRAWGIKWESKNRLDGERRYLIGSVGKSPVPELKGCTGALMFETRKACREHIKQQFGYIRNRRDLRDEPHGWRMPKAVRIEVRVQETSEVKRKNESSH